MNKMQEHYHPSITISDYKINIDEQLIDIYDTANIDYPDWQPENDLQPYETLSKLYLDIETSGLDPVYDRVYMIGLRDEKGINKIFSHDDEKQSLIEAVDYIKQKNAYFLFGYNHQAFDIPFLIERCKHYKIKHPFKKFEHPITIRATKDYKGDPITFYPCYAGFETNVIDLMHEVYKWDFSRSSLTSHTLKQAVLQMGLRKEQRLELPYQRIKECWETGDKRTLIKYLIYDLEDTQLLADRLVPDVYYQKLFLPDLKCQKISTMGNASKWNIVVSDFYINDPQPTPTHSYKGGYTEGYHGLYQNFSKIDVSSLYPSIMLTYGIASRKDPEYRMLGVLRYLLTERLRLKNLAKNGDTIADQKQGALKILINSAYGFLGTTGIPFNDYEGAALVTAYGRIILHLMIDIVRKQGGNIIEVDTDGIYYNSDQGFEKNREIYNLVNQQLPKGIEIDYEVEERAIYIPAEVKIKKRAKTVEVRGLRKNYIIFKQSGKVSVKGKFRKKDRSVLDKTYELEYLKRYIDSPESAHQYYTDLINRLRTRSYPVENLSITRKIKITEKALLHLGKHNEVITFYQGKTGAVSSGDYDPDYYIDLINEMTRNLRLTIDPDYTQELELELFGKQLSLLSS